MYSLYIKILFILFSLTVLPGIVVRKDWSQSCIYHSAIRGVRTDVAQGFVIQARAVLPKENIFKELFLLLEPVSLTQRQLNATNQR